MLSWRKISRPSSPAFCISEQVRARRSAYSSRAKCSAISSSLLLGELRQRAPVDRQRFGARGPASLGDQFLHVVANLVEPREPHAALALHIIEQLQRCLE